MKGKPPASYPALGAGRIASLLPSRRRKDGLVYIEGEKLVHEALAGDWECRLLILEEGFAHGPRGAEMAEAAATAGIGVAVTSRKVLGRLTSCETAPPAGMVARPPDFALPAGESLPARILVLDRVSDPGNAGTLVRGAAAFGFVSILTMGGVRPTNEKFLRSSAGLCLRRGRVLSGGEPATLASMLFRYNVQAVLLDPYAPRFIEDFAPDPARPLALILGNESSGADRRLWQGAAALRIQTSPLVESLNVAMAGTIALHHFRRAGGLNQ